MNMNERDATVMWYEDYGWMIINKWLSEMAAKNVRKIFIANFEFIPPTVNTNTLIEVFNADSSSWKMKKDEDGDLLCVNTRK